MGERQNQLLLVLLCVGDAEALWLWPWTSYQGALHINSIRIQTSTPHWRWREGVMFMCLWTKSIPVRLPKSTNGWDVTFQLGRNQPLFPPGCRRLIFFFLSQDRLNDPGFSATWSHFGEEMSSEAQNKLVAAALHSKLCVSVCYLHVSVPCNILFQSGVRAPCWWHWWRRDWNLGWPL